MTTDAINASIVIAVTGCEEWWFGGVGVRRVTKVSHNVMFVIM